MRTMRGLLAAGFLLAVPCLADDEVASKAAEDWTQVPVVALRKAVADRLVEASGSNPQSYHAVTLRLRNTTSARVAVDIAGSYLTPLERGSCQRLGLGPAITPSATIRRGASAAVVQLAPGAEQVLDVNTCCLDLGLPAPDTQSFNASADPLPQVREGVLRWWADHPETPQCDVNSAIWQNSPKVRIDATAEPPARAKRRSATVRGGVYYEIVDGELTSVDPDGVMRLLGNRIEQVFPTGDALFSVMPGDDGAPKLWRLEVTGERCWSRVTDLEEQNRLLDVLTVGKGNIVLVTEKGVDFRDGRKGTTTRVVVAEDSIRPSVRRVADDRLAVTTRRPALAPIVVGGEAQGGSQAVYELWTLALDTGRAERTREFWNVRSMLAGPAGVFALAPTQGGLRRLAGTSFTDIGPNTAYARVVAVATDLLWAADPDGRFVAVDARTGRVRFRTEIPVVLASASNVDPKTGDLAYVKDDAFHWIHGADGRDETIPER